MIIFSKIITTVMVTTLLSSPFLNTDNSYKLDGSTNSNQNLFLRIDDISELNAGDKVIITNQYGGVLDHFGGNPTYLCSRDYSYGSGLGDKYFIADSLSNYQVLNVGKVGDYFTFQFTYTYSSYWDKVICEGKYFCYRQSDGYWEGSSKVYLLGDLYFTDNPNSEYAQWKFFPNGDRTGVFKMQRSGEADGTFITYISGTTRNRFWYGGNGDDYGVRLYKYVNLDDYQPIFNNSDISDPNRTVYYDGEAVDLTGLEFNLYLVDKDLVIDNSTDLASEAIYTIHSVYESEMSLYSSITIQGSGETARAVFTYLGLTYRVFITIIEESSESSQYQLMNYSLSDYRGTYYLGIVTTNHPYVDSEMDESSYSVSLLRGTANKLGQTNDELSMNIATEVMDVPTSGVSSDIAKSTFEVKRVTINSVSNTYLYNPFVAMYLSYDDNDELCYVEENELTSKEVFSVINNKPVLNDDMYIVLSYTAFSVSSDDTNAASMFKLMPKSDFYTALNTFKTLFFEKIQCVAEGSVNFTSSDWDATKTAFEALSVDVQGHLANLTYVHNEETSGSVADMIDRYDYILSKYPDTYVDYMNRKEAAYINNYTSYTNSASSQFIQENSSLIIIVITMCLVMIAPTMFIIYKRRAK